MNSDISFTIRKMKWDNMFLIISIEAVFQRACVVETVSFYIKNTTLSKECLPLEYKIADDGSYLFRINIPQMQGRSFLNNGEWVIEAEVERESYPVFIGADTAYRLQDLSRVFRYEVDKAYVISFSVDTVSQDSSNLVMIIESSFMKTNKRWRDKKTGLPDKVIKAVRKTASLSKAPGKKHVLFLTETKDELHGNLKTVYDGFIKSSWSNDYKTMVYARNDVRSGMGVKGLLTLARLIADQDIILVDDYVPVFSYIDPPKGCQLIQLWHANMGFKSVGYSRFGREGSPHPEWSCHRKYSTVFVPHKDMINVYREVFGIEKEAFKVVGCPKLDSFNDPERIKSTSEELKDRYPVFRNKKIVLFAPTYRGAGEKDAFYDYSAIDLGQLYDAIGENGILVIKMHPFISKRISIPTEYSSRIIDMTDYPEINDLYYITDLMITDYSSDFFEYALLRKPVLFYTYDRDAYQLTRGVHRDVKEHAPGKVCDSFNELIEAIKKHDFDFNKTLKFAEKYGSILDINSVDLILKDVFGQ